MIAPEFATAFEFRMLVMMLVKISTQYTDEALRAHDLPITGLQLSVLRTIQVEAYTITDIGKRLAFDPSTLVPVVDDLERKGLALRQKDPRDRRRTPLAITPRGEDIIRGCMRLYQDDPVVKAVRELGEEKSAALLALVRELIALTPEGPTVVDNMMRHFEAVRQLYQARNPQSGCDETQTVSATLSESTQGDET